MNDAEMIRLIKSGKRMLTDIFDESELYPLLTMAKKDIEDSTGKPFDSDNVAECLAAVTFVKGHIGDDTQTQEVYLKRYKEQLSKIATTVGGDY